MLYRSIRLAEVFPGGVPTLKETIQNEWLFPLPECFHGCGVDIATHAKYSPVVREKLSMMYAARVAAEVVRRKLWKTCQNPANINEHYAKYCERLTDRVRKLFPSLRSTEGRTWALHFLLEVYPV